jgi:hypothetical protein
VDETENLRLYYSHDGRDAQSGNEADPDSLSDIENDQALFSEAVLEKEAIPVAATLLARPDTAVPGLTPPSALAPALATDLRLGHSTDLGISLDNVYDFELPPGKRPRPDSFVATTGIYSLRSQNEENPNAVKATPFGTSEGRPSPLSPLAALIRPVEPYDQSVSNITEAMLLRYFIEDLSRWFDLNDPYKYFRISVPQRARTCQPLMHAILTASARHMTRIKSYQGYDGVVRYENRAMPDLNTETALHYHNECIKDLIHTSSGISVMGTEDFLAAAIILRFYEEVDAPLRDEERDSELFRQMAMTFFKTRPDVSSPDYPTTSPAVGSHALDRPADVDKSPALQRPSTQTPGGRSWTSEQPSISDKPHHAPYWVALRQEIHNSFVNQRAFLIPLPKVR